tara:strand:+ start:215 stop:469 length:255 start_codon:yes stop_codon:yes gene_type:complete
MIDKNEIREDFRKLFIKHSGCDIQESRGEDNEKEWPCGTCLNSIFGMLIDEEAEEYEKHNEPVDRINELWRFVLQMRDMEYSKD